MTPDVLGRDLEVLYRVADGRREDVDLATIDRRYRGRSASDVVSVEGKDNCRQAVIHRIKTVRGELKELGHPEYGSRHHGLIGQPNTVGNRNLVKLYILQALASEPRIEKVLKASVEPDAQRDRVSIALELLFIGSPVPQDLVIPFSFDGPGGQS
jgi:phage baseplate assembly protein W